MITSLHDISDEWSKYWLHDVGDLGLGTHKALGISGLGSSFRVADGCTW